MKEHLIKDRKTGYVFTSKFDPEKPLSRSTIYRIVRSAANNVGIQGFHPHMLRHCCATHMSMEKFNKDQIGEHLGH